MHASRRRTRRARVRPVLHRRRTVRRRPQLLQSLAWGDGTFALVYLVSLAVADTRGPDDTEELEGLARVDVLDAVRRRTRWALSVTRRSARDTVAALRRHSRTLVVAETLDVIAAAGVVWRMQSREAESAAWEQEFAAWEVRGRLDRDVARPLAGVREVLAAPPAVQRAWLVRFLDRYPNDPRARYGGK